MSETPVIAFILMAAGFLLLGYVMHRAHKTDRARLVAVHREELARIADDAEDAREQQRKTAAELAATKAELDWARITTTVQTLRADLDECSALARQVLAECADQYAMQHADNVVALPVRGGAR